MDYWWWFSIPIIIALCMLAILFKPEIWDNTVDNHNFDQYTGQDGGDVLVTLQTLFPEQKKFEVIGPDINDKIVKDCGKEGSLRIYVSKTGKVKKIE